VPGLNLLADALNPIPMIPDRIQQLLSMFATVEALLLGVTVSQAMSVNYAELQAAALRFAPNGTYDFGPQYTQDESMMLEGGYHRIGLYMADQIGQGTAYLSTGLLITLCLYFALAVTSFRDPWTERNTSLLRQWWLWIRLSLFVNLVLLLTGTFATFWGVWEMMLIKFPNPACAGLGSATRGCLLAGSPGFDMTNPSKTFLSRY